MCAQTIEVEQDEERKGKERKSEAQQNATYLPRQPRGQGKENEEVGGVVRTRRESETSPLWGRFCFWATVVVREEAGSRSRTRDRAKVLERVRLDQGTLRVFSSSTGMTTEGCKELPKVGTSSRSRFREDLLVLDLASGREKKKKASRCCRCRFNVAAAGS